MVAPSTQVPVAGSVRRLVEDDCTALWLSGEHDMSTASVVTAAIAEAAHADEQDIVVDLRELTFMDASMVSRLIEGRNLLAASPQRGLYVRHPSEASRRVLELVGLLGMIRADPLGRGRSSALESWVEVPPEATPGPDRS